MRIGELAKRTGTSQRQLRYYEDQGLITSRRTSSGYRVYDSTAACRILQIRNLIDSGVPTRMINTILPCLNGLQSVPSNCSIHEVVAQLRVHHDKITQYIERLTRNRDAIAAYIESLNRSQSAQTTIQE